MKRQLIIFILWFGYAISLMGRCMAEADITFHGVLIKSPVCLINEGKDINIYFGDSIALNRIQSGYYRQPLGISLTCEDSNETWQLSLVVNGQPADFDAENSTVVSEQQDSLGVKFYVNSRPIPLGERVTVTESDLSTAEAVLVARDGSTLIDGDFSAQATLRAEYF